MRCWFSGLLEGIVDDDPMVGIEKDSAPAEI